MERGEGLEALVVLYTVAFFAGSLWDLLFPTWAVPGFLSVFLDMLPARGGLLFYLSLPVVGGLFFGLLGIPLNIALGYENRGIFTLLSEMMKVDLTISQYPLRVDPTAWMFSCYAVWLMLTVSGSVLGASFSYLHEDSRWEMLVSGLVYTATVLFLFTAGGCP